MEVTYIVYTLMGFMILGAIIAVETADLLSAVICLGAAGAGVSIMDLLLGAPDLALPQVVVEIICLVALIRVVISRRDTHHATSRETLSIALVVAALGFILTLTYFSLGGLSPFGSPHMTMSKPYLDAGLASGAPINFVNYILLDFRAYDTIAMVAAIFAAITGSYAVLRHVGRKRETAGHVVDR